MSFPKYKYLITYRLSEIIFDLVDAFVLRYLSYLGNLSYLSLKDQVLKTARSIKQNIIEGVSEVASLKSQIKLLGVAYGSVEELIADFEDFLRRKKLEIYSQNNPKVITFRRLGKNLSNLSNLNHLGHLRKKPVLPTSAQDAANLILTLSHQLSYLLAHQIKSTEERFVNTGGYTENLYHKRLKKLKLLKLPKSLRSPAAFTLMESLIIVAFFAVLAIAAFILLNPKKQLEKAWDSKRKHELNQLKKVLEDWYNDKQCYPKPVEICYDSPASNNTCHICGAKSPIRDLSPYLSRLPCDPQSPQKDYLYQVDSLDCPKWYRIYADLSLSDYTNNDSATKEVGCYSQSCGPAPKYGYDYGKTSENIDLEKANNFTLCATTGCNTCDPLTYEECFKKDVYYFCDRIKRIYPNLNLCLINCPCQP